jgi:hypothetical protein
MVSKIDKNQSVFTKTKELGKFVTKNCEKKLDPKTRIVMETNHKMCIVMVYKICQSEQIDKNKKIKIRGLRPRYDRTPPYMYCLKRPAPLHPYSRLHRHQIRSTRAAAQTSGPIFGAPGQLMRQNHLRNEGFVSQDHIGGFSMKRECANTHN